MAETQPLGITPPEHTGIKISVAEQHAEVAAQLGRVAGIGNKAMQDQVVKAAADLLDPDNLQTEEGGEVTNNFQILNLLPKLHKLDPEVAEEKIVELAVAEPYIDNQEFILHFQEELVELRSGKPPIYLPKNKRGVARAEASVEVHSQRDVHYPAEEVDESKKKD